MRPIIDVLNESAVDSVQKSGALTSTVRMAVVSSVGSNGTINATAGPDSFPTVRLLSGCPAPTVGATVTIMQGVGGWVCVGQHLSTAPPAGTVIDQRAGIVSSGTLTANTGKEITVTYPAMKGSTFVGIGNPQLSGTTGTTGIVSVAARPTATSATFRIIRSTTTATDIHWSVLGIA